MKDIYDTQHLYELTTPKKCDKKAFWGIYGVNIMWFHKIWRMDDILSRF